MMGGDGRDLEQKGIKTTEVVLEPIGVRIMGEIDPRTLTLEQYRSSPDLLFHGTDKPFEFSPIYDYSFPDYFTNHDGSETLGEGFYVTDDRKAAENYSRVRQGEWKSGEPIVSETLPYEAKMLDLRSKTNNSKNAPVSKELFDRWFEHFQSYYLDEDRRKDLPWYIKSSQSKYFDYLLKLRRLVDDVYLRVMLGTAPSGNREVGSLNYPSPPWMRMFSNFMLEQGYDGVVSIEGGEGRKGEIHTTYVFYNLLKIGTFESWHNKKTSG